MLKSLRLNSFLGFFLLVIFNFQASRLNAQLTANFAADTTNFCAPFTVSFIDLSTGSPNSYLWDFGNGNSSNDANPQVTYFNPGNYTVKLIISDGINTDSLTKINFVIVKPKPTSYFKPTTPMEGCLPLNVSFEDSSYSSNGSITSYIWDFGDGNSSSSQNPTHTYTTLGSYNVSLIIEDVAGCKNVYTHPSPVSLSEITANFNTPVANYCSEPAIISFNNTSVGSGVLDAEWDFGDGNTSTLLTPTNTYSDTGLYTVSLIISDAGGCTDTMVRNNYIAINPPISDFEINTFDTCKYDTINMTNTSPYGSNFTWLYGDGSSSTSFDGAHSYSDSGHYTVSLISNFAGCSDTTIKSLYIRHVAADFAADTTYSCRNMFNVSFTDSSENAISWVWSFGDGDSSILQNPQHIYQGYGTFSPSLIATDTKGCSDTNTYSGLIEIIKPVADFEAIPETGCVPIDIQLNDQSVSNEPIVYYEWLLANFGLSNDTNPNISVTTEGTHRINLVIFNNVGCSDTLYDSITVGNVPVILFGPDPDTLCIEDTIFFKDSSLYTQTWLWDFGDGSTSTNPEPEHAYMDTGYFDLKVIHFNKGCYDTMEVDSFVYVAPPKSNFGFDIDCDSVFKIQFNDSSTLADSYIWDFGDGDSVIGIANPTHYYDSTGDFQVELTIDNTNSGCTHTYRDIVYIRDPVANFTWDIDSGCAPLEITFDASGSQDVTFYTWEFGDGQGSVFNSSPIDSNTFNDPGIYGTKLIVLNTFNQCYDTLSYDSIISVFNLSPNFIADLTYGCTPLSVNFTDQTASDFPIVSWNWNLGNSVIDSIQNPSTIYTLPWSYIVSLTVIDSFGCEKTHDKIAYVRPTYPFPSFKVNTLDTFVCINTPLDFINTSGVAGGSYTWDFGDGNTSNAIQPTHTYDSVGVFSVTLYVVDSNGCDSLMSPPFNYCNGYGQIIGTTYNIHIIDPKAGFTTADQTIANCPSLLINFSDTSTGNVVSWDWDFGDQSNSVLQSPLHTYTYSDSFTVSLSIITQEGCRDTFVDSNFIIIAGPYAEFTMNTDTNCKPFPYTFIIENQENVVNHSWDFGDGLVGTGDTAIHIYGNSGSFTPSLILDDGLGCIYSIPADTTIEVNYLKAGFITNDTLGCAPHIVNLVDTSIEAIAWEWDFGTGPASTSTFASNIFQNRGHYDIQLVVWDTTGCTDTLLLDSIIRVMDITPNISIDTSTGCAPLTVQFNDISVTDTNIVSYNWDLGDTTSTLSNPSHTYTETLPKSISLVLVDALGCTAALNWADTILPTFPDIDINSNDTLICLGLPVNFINNSSGQGLTHLWVFGDGDSSTAQAPSHTYPDSGLYTIKYIATDINQCKDSITFNKDVLIQDPVAYFTNNLIVDSCNGVTVQFTDSSYTDIIGWEWHFGNGDTSSDQNPLYNFDSLGTYNIMLIATSSGGCKDTVEVSDLVKVTGPYGEIDVTPIEGCSYTSFDFNITVDSNLNNYYWNMGDGNTSNGSSFSYIYDTTGTFLPELVIDDPNCNYIIPMKDSVYIEYLKAEFSLNDNDGCLPHLISTTSSSVNANSFEWKFGDGGTQIGLNPSYTYNTSGTFNCQLIITSPIGCKDTFDQSVEVFALPIVNKSSDTAICDQKEAYLTAGGGIQCLWSPAQFLNDENNCSPTASPDSSQYFYITITDANSCTNSDSIYVTVYQVDPTSIDITPDTSIAIGDQLQLWANINGSKYFEWDPADNLSCNDCPDPIFSGVESQNYTLTIIDSNQCVENQQYIYIEVRDEFTVNLPQAFTPNNDGISDVIGVRGWGIKELLEFKVYNRWGEQMYVSDDINDGWDGTYRGEDQISGTYVYVVRVKNYKNETFTTKGNFLLLR